MNDKNYKRVIYLFLALLFVCFYAESHVNNDYRMIRVIRKQADEIKFLKKALDTNWIAPKGPHLDEFEDEVRKYVNRSFSLGLSSGTAALHLAMKVLNIKKLRDYLSCLEKLLVCQIKLIVCQYHTQVGIF